jgi:hypothetical protein
MVRRSVEKPVSQIARYTVSLTVEVPIDAEESAEAYTSQKAKSAMERQIIQLMRRAEGDTDCEVMAVVVTDDNEI